jgi:hypothetical protein
MAAMLGVPSSLPWNERSSASLIHPTLSPSGEQIAFAPAPVAPLAVTDKAGS